MKTLTLLSFFILGSMASAYEDGTYSCKNRNGLANDIYKVKTITIPGIEKSGVPFIEMTRYYHENPSDVNSRVIENHISGFATKMSNSEGSEILQLAALTFEFDKNRLLNCNP